MTSALEGCTAPCVASPLLQMPASCTPRSATTATLTYEVCQKRRACLHPMSRQQQSLPRKPSLQNSTAQAMLLGYNEGMLLQD